MNDTLRLLIVEDHPVFRRGIRALLSTLEGFEIVGEAHNGVDALELALSLLPDVILLDLQLPGMSGIDACREIVRQAPSTGILVITLFGDDDSLFSSLRAGARGYVLKDADEQEIVSAIRSVAAGHVIFSPGVANRVLAFFAAPRRVAPQVFPTLTEREREVLHFIAQGKSNPVIAGQLSLSPKTVANNVSNILGKLQVADRAAAIIRAREAGLGRSDADD